MTPEQHCEALLQQPCHIIDFLPRQVMPHEASCFFAVEHYFLRRKMLHRTADSFVRIILKALCYFECWAKLKTWQHPPDCHATAKAITLVVMTQKGEVLLLLPQENTLLVVTGGDLHLSIYNSSDNVTEILQALAASEGFFWRTGQD